MKLMLTNEQKTAINHDKGNILVSASAGSGKTFVMIQRLIRLIVEGKANVDEILAVTFTTLAAAEMKEKLINAITDKINHPDTDEQTAERLKAQLAEVPMASISTFHSFCKDLIKNYFYELGLDASFNIADETQANILKARAIDAVFERRYATGDEGIKRLLSIYISSRDDGALKKNVLDLHEFFESEAYPEEMAERTVEVYTKEGYQKTKTAFFEYYRTLFGKLCERCEQLVQEFDELGLDKECVAADEIRICAEQLYYAGSIIEMAKTFIVLPARLPPKNKNDDEYVTGLRASLTAAKKLVKTEWEYLRENYYSVTDEELEAELVSVRPSAQELIELYRDFRQEYSAVKREENVVDFADLEHFALELLDKDEIREAVSSRYEYVFADEYQDTNGVQEKILTRVSNNNLFMVGDVKQCIYAFRGCNPTIFEKKFQRFLNGEGTALSLTSNFRSSSEVLACVNNVFSEIMTEESCGTEYRNNPMRGGNGQKGLAQLSILLKEKGQTDKSAVKRTKSGVYSVKENLAGNEKESGAGETVMIASLIKQILGTTITDKNGVERPVTYSDIVILSRGLGAYAKRLMETLADNDIPVTCAAKKEITVYPETRMLIALLRLLDCARQDVPLIAVMRGPIGQFTDGELAEIRAFSSARLMEGQRRDERSFADAAQLFLQSGEGELKQKVEGFFADLERWRFLADYDGAGDVLARVVREKELDLFYLSARDGEERLKRINALISGAYSAERQYSVKEYLERIDAAEDDLALTETAGGESVNIMTIHASKGLEFPVVIVCGLNNTFSSADLRDELIKDRELGVAFKSYDLASMRSGSNLFRELIKKRYKIARAREEMRILYVALTRAQNALYLTETVESAPYSVSYLEVISASSYSKLVSYGAADVREYTKAEISGMQVEEKRGRVIASQTDDVLAGQIARGLTFEYPHPVSVPAKSSVTAILKDSASEVEYVPTLFPDDGSAIERGNAYHRVMELVDFNKPLKTEVISQIEAFTSNGLMKREYAEMVDADKIVAILKDDYFRMDGARYFRELPFEVLVPAELAMPGSGDEEVLVQGVIDLIAFTEDGIYIADYKVSGRGCDALGHAYARQLELYAFAAERITGKRVLGKRLYNLSSGERIEL